MKEPIAVVFRASQKAKLHKMIVFKNHTIDEVLSNTKKRPLLPYTNHIDTIGVGKSFITRYQEKYKIKNFKELE